MSFLDDLFNNVTSLFAPKKPKMISEGFENVPTKPQTISREQALYNNLTKTPANKVYGPPSPSKADLAYNKTMSELNKAQNMLNPLISQANENARRVHVVYSKENQPQIAYGRYQPNQESYSLPQSITNTLSQVYQPSQGYNSMDLYNNLSTLQSLVNTVAQLQRPSYKPQTYDVAPYLSYAKSLRQSNLDLPIQQGIRQKQESYGLI